MLTGHHVYEIEQNADDSVSFPDFTFTPSGIPSVTSVEVKTTTDKKVIVTVQFKDVTDVTDAAEAGLAIAERVASQVAYTRNVVCADPRKTATEFVDETGKQIRTTTVTKTLNMRWNVGVHVAVTVLAEVQNRLEATNLNQDVFMTRLRWVMAHTDPVAVFLQLYAILLEIKGPKQSTVETFLNDREQIASGKDTRTYWNSHLNKNETVYSHLRNRLAHVVKGTTAQDTKREIEKCVQPFLDHVKAAILDVV